MEQEREQLPDLHVSQMSDEHLNELVYIFVNEKYKPTSFAAFWRTFLQSEPTYGKVEELFETVEDLGYYLTRKKPTFDETLDYVENVLNSPN